MPQFHVELLPKLEDYVIKQASIAPPHPNNMTGHHGKNAMRPVKPKNNKQERIG